MNTTWSCVSRVKLYYIRVRALSIMISRVSRLIVVSSVIPQALAKDPLHEHLNI